MAADLLFFLENSSYYKASDITLILESLTSGVYRKFPSVQAGYFTKIDLTNWRTPDHAVSFDVFTSADIKNICDYL